MENLRGDEETQMVNSKAHWIFSGRRSPVYVGILRSEMCLFCADAPGGGFRFGHEKSLPCSQRAFVRVRINTASYITHLENSSTSFTRRIQLRLIFHTS